MKLYRCATLSVPSLLAHQNLFYLLVKCQNIISPGAVTGGNQSLALDLC